MSLELKGKIAAIYATQQVSDRFKKRDFVLEISEEFNGKIYSDYAKMQTVQNKCDLLDRFRVGDTVKVSFNIKGNKFEKDGKVNYMTNLDAWRIESVGSAPASNNNSTNNNYSPAPEDIDSLPF